MSSQIPDEHDPLCHMAGRYPNEVYMFSIPCECETIQRVRADEHRKVAEEIERLTRWKAEAIEVLDAWEEVWKALGSPGGLGESKARASRAKAAELMAGGTIACRKTSAADLRLAAVITEMKSLRDGLDTICQSFDGSRGYVLGCRRGRDGIDKILGRIGGAS